MAAKVALVQFSANRDVEYNVQRAEQMAREAASNGAQIICYHELATTIYFCYENNDDNFQWAQPIPGPAVNRLSKVAKETGTVIVYPLFEKAGDTYYNSAAVIGPDGQLIGIYRKNSIPQIMRRVNPEETKGDEGYYFSPGNLGFPVFKTPFGVNIGILICYDRHFPEAARVLALQGAHIILVPTATYRQWIREVWEIELRAHAVANGVYVGGVNKVGPDVGGAEGRFYWGSSFFVDPMGRIIVKASDKNDDIIYTDVDPAACDDAKDLWGFFRKRRPDAYSALVETVG